MSVYLDASVLVPLFADDPLSDRAQALLREHASILIVSDFAAAEFASAMARLVRIRDITVRGARAAFSAFDIWTSQETQRVQTTPGDIEAAIAFIRRLDSTLRAPDAIHIAITQRVRAKLLTLDRNMLAAARILGTNVVEP